LETGQGVKKVSMTGPAVCRFYGCDATVSATVGIMPLCLLHRSYVLQLMDRGTHRTADDGPAFTSDGWQLIHAGDVDI
jgi:hypothetical protein